MVLYPSRREGAVCNYYCQRRKSNRVRSSISLCSLKRIGQQPFQRNFQEGITLPTHQQHRRFIVKINRDLLSFSVRADKSYCPTALLNQEIIRTATTYFAVFPPFFIIIARLIHAIKRIEVNCCKIKQPSCAKGTVFVPSNEHAVMWAQGQPSY